MSKSEKASAETNTRSRKLKLNKSYLLIAVLVLLLAGAGYGAYSKIDSLEKEKKQLSDPQEAAKQETARIKQAVAKLIDVPSDEDPTIASVVDSTKLKNQAFFAKAENGDKVLMYAQAKKAILYRPSTNKVIEVAPINIGDNNQNQSQQPALQGGNSQ